VDRLNTAELRTQAVDAIATAGISCSSPGDVLKVSSGWDTRIWLSLDATADEQDRRTLSEQVVAALAVAGHQLLSFAEPQSSNPAERLRTGEALYVAPIDALK